MSQVEHCLVALIEKQVEDGEVGQEPKLLLINLIIRARHEP